MHILQSGEAKSGNYWMYTIIQSIIKESGIQQKSFIKEDPIYPIAASWELSTKNQVDENVMDFTPSGCFYRISSIYRQPIINVDQYVKQNTHVWTHSPFNEMSARVFPLFDKRIYIIRDPRDVLLSMAKFCQTPYMKKYYPSPYGSIDDFVKNNAIRSSIRWAKNVTRYVDMKNEFDIHIIFYENLLNNTNSEVARLLEYLDIPLSKKSKESILDSVSFDRMQQDNPHHVNKAQLYGWKSSLDNTLNKKITSKIGAVLKNLNYPIKQSDHLMPSVNSKFSIEISKMNKKSIKDRLRLVKAALT